MKNDYMTKIYAKLVKEGAKKIEDVPPQHRAEVEALLAKGE